MSVIHKGLKPCEVVVENKDIAYLLFLKKVSGSGHNIQAMATFILQQINC